MTTNDRMKNKTTKTVEGEKVQKELNGISKSSDAQDEDTR